MNTSEMTSMIVASADPKPIRLASPTTLLRDQRREQLQAVAALVDDPDEVEGAQRLDDRDDEDDDVDRPHHREDDPEERLHLVRPVDLRRLAQAGVDALQARQVQQHDVADVPPARGDQAAQRLYLGSPKKSIGCWVMPASSARC